MKKLDIVGKIAAAAAHLMIILGINLTVLLVLDVFFNRAMNFLGNYFFKISSLIFVVCGFYLAFYVLCRRAAGKNNYR